METPEREPYSPVVLLRIKASEVADLRELLTLVAQDLERLGVRAPGTRRALPGSGDATAAS